VPQVQEVWNKLNARERLTAIGALLVVLGWIVGLAGSFGLGGSTIALIGAIAVLAIFFLKYSPNQSITWPAPIPLIVLGISAIVALLAVLALLPILQLMGLGGFSFFGVAIIAAILTAVGGVLMVWGAWQEYSLTKPATTSGSATSSAPPPPAAPPTYAPPAAPTTPPPAAPTTTPPSAPSASDSDDLPPA
jgi:hypothetical protein